MSGRKWIKGRRKSSVSAATRAATTAVKRAIVNSNKRRSVMYMSPKNVEKKYWDILLTTTNAPYCANPVANTLPTTPVGMIVLNAIPLGNGPSGRIGRNITITSIFYRNIISLESTATTGQTQMTRTAIVLDKQANGTTPLIQDIYVQTAAGPPVQVQPYSPMNLDNSMRFKILSDENRILLANGALSGAGLSTATSNVCWIENYIRTNIRVNYNTGTNGDQRDIATNALYIITIGEFTSAQGYNAVSNGLVRIRYTDD